MSGVARPKTSQAVTQMIRLKIGHKKARNQRVLAMLLNELVLVAVWLSAQASNVLNVNQSSCLFKRSGHPDRLAGKGLSLG